MADTEKQYPFGIVGVDLKTVERRTPPDQPPALPINKDLAVIGKPVTRLDGALKTTGHAKYSADIRLPGLLYAYMLVSPVPAAKIKSIDTKPAETLRGVAGVHILEHNAVRYAGQPIAAVAAETPMIAEAAVRLIKLDLEPVEWVVNMEKAMQPDAPQVTASPSASKATAGGGGALHGPHNGNVIGPNTRKNGDIDKGFAEAEVIIEAEYKTQVQTQCALETHGLVADWKPDMLTVYASTQGTGSVRDELADLFDLQKSQVRVITEYMGGGFGAKFGAGHYGALATHLSKKTGKPVWLMLDRKQEHLCTGNRPNSHQKYKIGAKKDGTLTAIQAISYGTGGVGGGAGATGPVHSMYPCPNVHTEDSDVLINAGPASAFRAPGFPQGVFSLEQAIDELADKLGMDPLALREKIDDNEARRVERKIGAEKIGWNNRHAPGADQGPIKRGLGVASSVWHRNMSRTGHCEVRITHDGSVEILSSVQDIGGGIRTALAQIVAEDLGLKPTDITVRIGDTNYPAGPASGGSVTTNTIAPAAHDGAWKAKQLLLAQIAPAFGASSPDQLDIKGGKVFVKADHSKSMDFRSACRKMRDEQISAHGDRIGDFRVPDGRERGANVMGGVQFARVAVDTETGIIKVEKVVAVHDCGRCINPLATTNQINGGIIQGISYCLYEDRILDSQRGLMVNPNLDEYKITGAKEVPEIDVTIIEQYWAKSNLDSAGIGEPAIIPAAAAVANAVFNATGVRIRQIPMTPDIVLAALGKFDGGLAHG